MTAIWAHRGASAAAPENTLPAFELAIAHGADGIELDVQLSADGVPVAIHDESLQRTTGVKAEVGDLSATELANLDAGKDWPGFSGTGIPSLAEVMHLVAPTGLRINVELKDSKRPYPGLAAQVLQLAESAGLVGRTIVSSFNHRSLKRQLGNPKHLPVGMLYSDLLYKPWRYAAKLGAQALHPPLYATTRKLIRKCHEHHQLVNVWTVNDDDDIERMIRYEADAIITDVPDRARELRGS